MKSIYKELYNNCRLNKAADVKKLLQAHSQLDLMYETGDLFKFTGRHNNLEMFNLLVEYYMRTNSSIECVARYRLNQICQEIQDTYCLSAEMEGALDDYTAESRYQEWLSQKFEFVNEAVAYGQYSVVETIADLMDSKEKKATIYKKAGQSISKSGRVDETAIKQAEQYFQLAIKIKPKYSSAYKQCGLFLQEKTQDHISALECFIKAYMYRGSGQYDDVYVRIEELIEECKYQPLLYKVLEKYLPEISHITDLKHMFEVVLEARSSLEDKKTSDTSNSSVGYGDPTLPFTSDNLASYEADKSSIQHDHLLGCTAPDVTDEYI